MKAMVEELGRQYRLEYRSNNPARDGKWLKIKVVVAPDGEKDIAMVVRSRAGYYVSRGEQVRKKRREK